MSTYRPVFHPGFFSAEAWGGGEEGDGSDMYGHAATHSPYGHRFGEFEHVTPEELISNGLGDDIPVPERARPPVGGRRRLVRDAAPRITARAA